DGQVFDMAKEMMDLTMMIVGKALFDTDVESETRTIEEAMSVIMKMFNVLMLPHSELLEKLPIPAMKKIRKAQERLNEIIFRLIAERRRDMDHHSDLLSMLLRAQDETNGCGMSDQQVRDEAMTIFLAGHETTANALIWTWYLLSKNPAAEERFHEE